MVGEVLAGRYELEELVGTGGMSSVYRAQDRLLDRKVALKILHEHYGTDDTYVARFRHEARAVAALSHPNILALHDVGRDGAVTYAAHYPIGYPAILSVFYALFGSAPLVAMLVNAAFGSVCAEARP